MTQKLTPEQLEIRRAQERTRRFKQELEQEELLARMNKASYDKMYYFIEATALIPEYKRLLDAQEALRQQRIQEADDAIDKLAAEAQVESQIGEPLTFSEPESGSLEIMGVTVE